MNILETYYTYAKLSQVAYIDLSGFGSNPDWSIIATAAKNQNRVPEALAQDIFNVANPDYWMVLSPYYKTDGITGHSDPARVGRNN
jgi:hypothetical protein